MYEVEIELLICGINHVDGSVLILSDNESKVQIPHSIVGVEDELENVVNTIFKEYCNINITCRFLHRCSLFEASLNL